MSQFLDKRWAPLLIRQMRIEDLEQVQAIDQVSFSLPWPASAFRYELLENQHSLLWVAETELPEPRVVGVIVVWLILDEAHIATIAVQPEYRRLGIAARLMGISLLESIRREALTATLEVRANNTAAQALYHRFRFEVVGRRPRYYRDNQEDALLMTVELNRRLESGEAYRDWLEREGWKESDPRPLGNIE